MRLVDANVLLYAVNRDAERHRHARRWLDAALSGDDTVGFAWIVLLAFVRLSTKIGLFPRPFTVEQARARVDAWVGAGPAMIVQPTSSHLTVLTRLLAQVGSGGNLVNDAHLAALALEHRCSIISYDNDFGRFEGVTWEPPPLAPT